MKLSVLLAAGAVVLAGLAVADPAEAALDGLVLPPADGPDLVAADDDLPVLADRGRGRGRGGDHDDDDDRDDDDDHDDDHHADDDDDDEPGSGSGRRKPRIPGGSGCDDAGDIEEHAGCAA